MSTIKKIMVSLTVALAIMLGIGYFMGLAYFQTHFKIGTTINGFHCSFKSLEETDSLLAREVDSYALAVNTRNNGVEKVAAQDVGMRFIGRSTLLDILNEQNSFLWFVPSVKEYNLSVDCYEVDEEKINKEINNLKCMKDIVKSESAHIVEDENGCFQVEKAIKGTELDKTKTKQVIETAIRQWRTSINLEDAECYIDADKVDEKELQKNCEILNAIQDTVITYDFGDRTETIDIDVIRANLLDDKQALDKEKILKYIEKIAKKYDSVGNTRNFITFDDKTIKLSGGDYGWKIDVEKTSEELLAMIKENTIDVVNPIYSQEAASRDSNDIGYSYVEINSSNGTVIVYNEGEPILKTRARLNGGMKHGFYKIHSKQDNSLIMNGFEIYEDDGASNIESLEEEISGFAETNVKKGCAAIKKEDMSAVYDIINESWPVIIYNNSLN